MEKFPSESERTVASALLLLSDSNSPPSPSPSPPCLPSANRLSLISSSISSRYYYCFDDSNSKSSVNKKSSCGKEDSCFSDSKSCSSTLTSEGPSVESRFDQLKVLTDAAHFHALKLKAVKRSRSKHYRISDRRKNLSDEWRKPVIITHQKVVVPAMKSMKTTSSSREDSTSSSTLSSGSSSTVASHAAPNRNGSRLINLTKLMMMRRQKQQQQQEQKSAIPSSACLRRRAESIMKFLSVGSSSEVKIRQVLGDSPDTSKALRMLLKVDAIKRSGAGGPRDPFVYKVI